MHFEYLKKNGAVKTNVHVRYSSKKGKEMILLEIDTYTEEDMEEHGEFLFGEESYPDVGEIHGLTMVFDEQGAKKYCML